MFKVVKKSKKTRARVGLYKLNHGVVKTPFFMPVATQGTIKHVTASEMNQIGAEILLSNTYHLMLRPGESLVKKAGGLNKYMNWQKPILTDSGGFQVFSLSGTKREGSENLVKLTADGVKFKSYIDGREFFLTPEKAFKIQHDLGVDIAVCLDECSALPATRDKILSALELTTYWAKKTKNYYSKIKGIKPNLHCVVQGGLDKELRFRSLEELVNIGFDGYNIGGLSVGEPPAEMYEMLDFLVEKLPADKPRYLMGVGYPIDILNGVRFGVDMFDCVIPTREGRHGRLFLKAKDFEKKIKKYLSSEKVAIKDDFYEQINITKSTFASDFKPINPESKIPELRKLSKSYLNYLFKIKEPLALRLASLNNLEFYLEMMRTIRKSID